MFMTEVDELSGRAIHDEIARLLVEYLQTQPSEENRKFLNVIFCHSIDRHLTSR